MKPLAMMLRVGSLRSVAVSHGGVVSLLEYVVQLFGQVPAGRQ